MADFTLWWFFVPRGGFLHSAYAAVGMTERGDVLYGFAYCSWNVSGHPADPHQSGLRPASFPGGEALVPGFWVCGVLVTVPSFHVRNGT